MGRVDGIVENAHSHNSSTHPIIHIDWSRIRMRI